MCCENTLIEDLNPTFLFIWTGARTHDECCYHCHDHIEMDFILSGTGKYHIDGKYYTVREGDLIILNPGVKHQSLVSDSHNPVTEFFIGFSDIYFTGYSKNYFPLVDEDIILHTTGELRQRLFKICASMSAENAVYREGRYFMLKSYLMQILLLLIREQTEPVEIKTGCSFDSTNKKYVVEQIITYFEDHYNEKISLDQIAENMYLSPFYISRIFKSETGNAPIRYLISIRLEKAKELLEAGWEGSIQEVAAEVGYDDAYYFSKLFKKKYGVSPSSLK
ncbi:AraC family transcriptional regulator [Anaeromicropila populeti]|uniref:AraC-type DNA-binding protein n=1 Tax=Anaeromicropila populeti TaxID=37658 RepID=A0A1I6ISY8_9FIRM|nr:AraC family transcriptional regulator [Anaeromicropila populeti]SFR69833.1 AraC-type DNA-binding protein [Anaeromicropila populeti]